VCGLTICRQAHPGSRPPTLYTAPGRGLGVRAPRRSWIGNNDPGASVMLRRNRPETSTSDEVLTLRREVETLEAALLSSRLIGAAVGLVMAEHQVSRAAAIAMLRTMSQNSNTRLAVVPPGWSPTLTGELLGERLRRSPSRRPQADLSERTSPGSG